MTKRARNTLLSVLCCLFTLCLFFAVLTTFRITANADGATAQNVSSNTVAVHDPSIVLAYEDENGNTYPDRAMATSMGGGTIRKVYYVFGTQNAFAKSYDLKNWTSFRTNLSNSSNLLSMIPSNVKTYTGNTTAASIMENSWAPDVIYNTAMNKWCMYLTINGPDYNSAIVLLIADRLDGVWSYVDEIVFSGMGYGSNQTNLTDFAEITGSSTVNGRYTAARNKTLIYGMNAIDACVFYDGEDLYMTYGSFFGGIFMLKLDPVTGLRDKTVHYETKIVYGEGSSTVSNSSTYTVYSDEYFGLHIAGGHGQTGEGSYIQKMGDYYYLFMSYGGYAPDGGYNMRVFRSETITGYTDNEFMDSEGHTLVDNFVGYRDSGNGTAMVQMSGTAGAEDALGNRLMSGYTWSWWDFSYVAQGHNSAFVDDDGKAYVVYHNKYMDGTAFHVLKVHELFVNVDGYLVTSPFQVTTQNTELSQKDEIATGLTATDITGDYGTLYMTRNSGRYGNPVRENLVTLTGGTSSNGKITGESSLGNWTYNPENGQFTIRISQHNYNGYLIWQNLEETNIRTLAFTIIDNGYSKYTYWGYKYPTATQQAEYLINSSAIPTKAGSGVTLPSGDVTDTLWSKSVYTFESSGNTLTVKLKDGTEPITTFTVDTTESIAEFDKIMTGQKLPQIASTNGVAISFDYAGYSDDWTTILQGSNFAINLSTMTYGSTNIYEASAVPGAAYATIAAHQIFYTDTTKCATISFNKNGSITYYLDGKMALHYEAATKFNNNSTTVQTVCNAVLNAFNTGNVTVNYNMENVVIDTEQPYVAKSSVYDSENFLTPTDSTIQVIGEIEGNVTAKQIPAIANVQTNGLAVSFNFTNSESGANKDWSSVVITSGNYKITAPNLDSWGAGGTLASTNKYPESKNFHNGGAWDCFLGTTCFMTISISDSGITYYKNGVKVVSYDKGDSMNYNNSGASSTAKVSHFVSGILSAIQSNGFILGGGSVSGIKLIVTNALSETQAASLYQDYSGPVEPEVPTGVTLPSGITAYFDIAGDVNGKTVAKIENAATAGFSVTFKLDGASVTNVWDALIKTTYNLGIGVATLDPWNNTGTDSAHTSLKNHNLGMPDEDQNKVKNGTAYITITLNTDGSVVYYRNGEVCVTIAATVACYDGTAKAVSTTKFASDFTAAFLADVAASGFVLGANVSDAIVTNALTAAQTAALYNAYTAQPTIPDHDCDTDGHLYEAAPINAQTGAIVYTCTACEEGHDGHTYTAYDCAADGVVGYTYTVVKTPATCTTNASATFTSSPAGDSFTSTQENSALGHDWEIVWSWADDGSTATATAVCKRNSAHKEENLTVIVTSNISLAATCTEKGKTLYTAKVTFGGEEYTDEKELEDIDATGHSWAESTNGWVWTETETGYTATVRLVCGNNENHIETVEATVTDSVTTAATCTTKGVRTYTASATYAGQNYSANKTEDIAATGHNPDKSLWTYTHIEGKDKHLWYCGNEWGVGIEQDCDFTVTTERESCDVEGTAHYECKLCHYEKDKTLPAGTHSYGSPEWTWTAEDGYTATATFICTVDSDKQTVTATVTYTEEDAATCTSKGAGTYTATVSFDTNGNGTADTFTDTKEIEIPAIGHAYALAAENAWTWNGLSAATVSLVCANNTNHTQNIVAVITNEITTQPTCTEKGVRTYTATATYGGATYTDTKTEEVKELGHDWDTEHIAFTWTEYTGATAVVTCKNNEAHKSETLTATITSVVTTKATCTTDGLKTYTATVTFQSQKYTDTKPETLTALGHNFSDEWATNANKHWHVCENCDAKSEEANHTFVEVSNDDNAREQKCTVCDYRTHLEHSYGEATVTKAATCTEKGEKSFECEVCGHIMTEEIAATGHSWGEWTQSKAPSKVEKGEEKRTCSACNEVETREIAALGEGTEIAAFKTAVEAVSAASGLQNKFAAIKTAVEAYDAIIDKTAVATEYNTLKTEIAAYNTKVETANSEYASAVETALKVLATSLSAIAALAAAWAVFKRGL